MAVIKGGIRIGKNMSSADKAKLLAVANKGVYKQLKDAIEAKKLGKSKPVQPKVEKKVVKKAVKNKVVKKKVAKKESLVEKVKKKLSKK